MDFNSAGYIGGDVNIDEDLGEETIRRGSYIHSWLLLIDLKLFTELIRA
jgi:hypothetical protein